MRILRRIALVQLVAYSVSCTSTNHPARSTTEKAAQDPVRITQFYATKPSIPRGEDVLLCYGVENATAVRITPPVEQIRPALSRCITVSPVETTTFTLIAEDGSAKTSSQSITVMVTGPRPHFNDLSISSKQVAPGQLVTFCFKASNATTVRGSPGHFQHGGSPSGDCLIDYPQKTTAYSLVIGGAGGQTDDAKITVNVH
jgi:hypothetical protein